MAEIIHRNKVVERRRQALLDIDAAEMFGKDFELTYTPSHAEEPKPTLWKRIIKIIKNLRP